MRANRRRFLRLGSLGLCAAALNGCSARRARPGASAAEVMTVDGGIPPARMGLTLPHEHVLVDFIGAASATSGRYEAEEVFDMVLPHLERARDLGCETLVECTPAHLGRDPRLLQRLSRASGLSILTNTGYYGAGKNKYLPAHALSESAEELAGRWLREWREGISDTGIRPGFIKIGVDTGPLPEVHRKLARAAALVHGECGLTIAAHTGNGAGALEQLQILREEGVSAEAFIWVHAQSEKDAGMHLRVAEAGAWVEFDGVGPKTVARHVELVKRLKEHGLIHRLLLSHDAGWYHVGEPGGGVFRPFDTLFTELVPALREAGLDGVEIDGLLRVNPREAFTIRLRRGSN